MAKPEEKRDEQQMVTMPQGAFEALIEAKVRDAMAAAAKPFDEGMQERMDRQRGKDRPPIPEEMVRCKSPMTGATMTVRITKSRTTPSGRIVEMLDYVRPEGWDKHKDDGGLYAGNRDWMRREEGKPLDKGQHKFAEWVYRTFWLADWTALHGKPGSFIEQWRLPGPSELTADGKWKPVAAE